MGPSMKGKEKFVKKTPTGYTKEQKKAIGTMAKKGVKAGGAIKKRNKALEDVLKGM